MLNLKMLKQEFMSLKTDQRIIRIEVSDDGHEWFVVQTIPTDTTYMRIMDMTFNPYYGKEISRYKKL